MAHLAIVGSHAINGVSKIHSRILQTRLFRDFHEIFPERFQNKTNGISPRHWLQAANPALADLITAHIGPKWIKDLGQLKQLLDFRGNPGFCNAWREIKQANKRCLAHCIMRTLGIELNPDSIFDVQVKRIHEYKRQLLNILHVAALYNRIKKSPREQHPLRTVLFSGKAAPGYRMALLIIKLINSVGKVVNDDPDVGDRLKVVFLPNYSVTLAEIIIPAADLSQQISTAGMEASGTGNMKLALNGALTLGTFDGANLEIMEEVGEENFYAFGLKVDDILKLRQAGYDPRKHYLENRELKQAMDMIHQGYFSPENPDLFHPVIDSLLQGGDSYMVLADFEAYSQRHKKIVQDYGETDLWIKKSIANTANMGKFSGDRATREYSEDIWNIKPLPETFKIFPI